MIEQGSTLNNNSIVLSQSQLQNGTRPLDTTQVISQFNGYRTAPIERTSQEDYRRMLHFIQNLQQEMLIGVSSPSPDTKISIPSSA